MVYTDRYAARYLFVICAVIPLSRAENMY